LHRYTCGARAPERGARADEIRWFVEESDARPISDAIRPMDDRARIRGDTMRRYFSAVLITAALAGPMSACTAEVRIYDAPHRDSHRWNESEERAYRLYLQTRHREYVEFQRLSRSEQEEYWEWRHAHHDRDKDREGR